MTALISDCNDRGKQLKTQNYFELHEVYAPRHPKTGVGSWRTRNWLNLARFSGPLYRACSSYPGVDTNFFFLFPTNLPPRNISNSPGRCAVYSSVTSSQYPIFLRPTHITMSKTFSKDDVASHSKGDSLWIVIDEDVYDVTKFQDEHPGKFFFPSIRAV